MRLTHISDGQLKALAESDYAFSPRLLGHLSVCEDCQSRLAEYTQAFAGNETRQPEINDPGLADRVIGRIAKREERETFFRYAMIAFGATVLSAGAVDLTGVTTYLGALDSVWQMFVTLGQSLIALGGSTTIALSRLMAGSGEETILVVAALATLLWVGLLDKIAGRIRLARH